ncbi:MAG: ThuA domain-containing protein [Phycisphaeraceae bacterium]|nr:ThuA domain-containing protein [Phycisphaeraceae bacterium]
MASTEGEPPREGSPVLSVLVYTRTAGFRHDSIPAGIEAMRAIGKEARWHVESTETPQDFTEENLARFAVVVFLNTTGDVLNKDQEQAFERYIRGGGGYVGIHSASDTEYDWGFYRELVGAYFRRHPPVQQATVLVVDKEHPATRGLPERWVRTDEWYNFRALPGAEHHILARLDTESYSGSDHPEGHPVAWWREIDRGRALYTAGGHTRESFEEPLFRLHLRGAILWAAGISDSPDDAEPRRVVRP